MARVKQAREDESFTVGSGNVFRDLGFPNPDLMERKSELVSLISDAITDTGLTQVEVARRLRLDQPKVSRLLRGHFNGFSVYRLMEMLTALGRDVEILVTPRLRDAGAGSVRVVHGRTIRESRARGSARG